MLSLSVEIIFNHQDINRIRSQQIAMNPDYFTNQKLGTTINILGGENGKSYSVQIKIQL